MTASTEVSVDEQLDLFAFWIACMECDIDSPETMEEAIELGWQSIGTDVDAHVSDFGWTHLGFCPECIADPEKDTD